MSDDQTFDIAVIGAGFSGSLTALGLHQIGYDVVLIEKDSHPRFAIGESSTPIADLILRDLSGRFDLPWLRDISRYGSWQETHPEVACGLKRGFSYFKHKAGQPFQTDDSHKNELLVAASANDRQSDTNWFRSDVDAYFVQKVKESGISYWDDTRIKELNRKNGWRITSEQAGKDIICKSKWLIDATGSYAILNLLGVESTSTDFRTDTSAIFTHFSGVKPWQDWLDENGISSNDYPYNPDDSALHHLLDEGWLWMLRFNNGITSCGLVLNNRNLLNGDVTWSKIISKYPSLQILFEDAGQIDPPGQIIQSNRLQRRAEKAVGDRWVALPHTVGFVDPLHSTGIAHSLSGVERILHAFEVGKGKNPSTIVSSLQKYEEAVFNELDFMDLLVDGCYRSMHNFELFNIYSMLYFVAAINYEQNRLNGHFDIEMDQFLSANHPDIRQITEQFYGDLLKMQHDGSIDEKQISAFRNAVKQAIAPYNIAGLLEPDVPNMYHHTAAEF